MKSLKEAKLFYCELQVDWLPGATGRRNWLEGIYGYFGDGGGNGSVLSLDFSGI